MGQTTKRRPGIAQQLRLVVGTVRLLVRYPAPLLYPVLKALSGTLAIVAVGAIALSPVDGIGPDVPIGIPTLLLVVGSCLFSLYVVGPILVVLLDVAYCYELHALLQGTRPTPGSGLAYAVRRLPAISLGALAVTGTFFAGYVTDTGSLRVGSDVLGTFLPPALAIEDRSASTLVTRIDGAITDQWGSAVLTVYGARTFEYLAGCLGIATAVGVVVGQVLGVFTVDSGVLPVAPGLPQAAFLAVAVFLGGFALTAFLRGLVRGPVSTALYHYATRDSVPERFALDAGEMVHID
ncbi:hypothetical protein [Haloarcula pellucida]|uniref:Uncharacterized protein n=1 Tax=Haloarcula pellucida TaxID=1427151 RepID=A0A830GPB2_9EURY|nr:hypothetical protein [Halomicroarcula pellucida]MBX0348031.1 hypothetical protein [Halomicroarcula pellucida]GGN96589.1 hypothetical protein GCM10009030_25040 [Halomicroarcula pellucida]